MTSDEETMVREALEEAVRVLQNKTRSHVRAASDFARALTLLEVDRDRWRSRALGAEASRARCFTSVPEELLASVERQIVDRIRRVEGLTLHKPSPEDLDVFAATALDTAVQRTSDVRPEAEDPLTPSERPPGLTQCCAVLRGTGGGIDCELEVHHRGPHRSGDRSWPASPRPTEALPEHCGHCRYEAESKGVYVCHEHGRPAAASRA